MLTLLPGATAWTPLASLPRGFLVARASIVGGKLWVSGGVSKGYSSSRSEVFEYHPEPWNQWINKGNLETSRGFHAVLSIGTEHLPCLSGCPPLPPSPGHLCVAPAGAKDCHYAADHCCCGHCSESFTFSCARPDSTTETGFWKSTLCPEEGCGSEGEWWS